MSNSRASARDSTRRSRAPRLEAANLAGITTLMNPQHVKPGINLDAAEKSVMGKSSAAKHSEGDPVRAYTSELNRLAEELGIDLVEESGAATEASGKKREAFSVAGLIDDLDLDKERDRDRDRDRDKKRAHVVAASESDSASDYSSQSGSSYTGSSQSGSSYTGSSRSGSSYTGSSRSGSSYSGSSRSSGSSRGSGSSRRRGGDDDAVDKIITRLESDLGIGDKHRSDRHERRHRIGSAQVPLIEHSGGNADTEEQRRRRHINSVVADIRGETRTSFGVEAEREQDMKASKLEQIGQLRMTLEEEGIDCDSVSNPSSASPMAEIDSVLNILRLKNDRNRYSTLAEEVILGAAEGIETVFDGTREVPFFGWKPDYTGYHSTVNIKLHRMRFETSQVVGNIIQKFNIGSTSRIIMELLPSFFLYPRQQKKQRGAPGLSSDPHIADGRMAMSAIRASDERNNSLDEIQRI